MTVNVVVPGGTVGHADGADGGRVRPEHDGPAFTAMVPPILWLCSEAGGAHSGHRYVAAHWDAAADPVAAAEGCRTPIGWPDLAQNPVWPGGKPDRMSGLPI